MFNVYLLEVEMVYINVNVNVNILVGEISLQYLVYLGYLNINIGFSTDAC